MELAAADEGLVVRALAVVWTAAVLPILIASLPFRDVNGLHKFLIGFAKRGKIMQSPSDYRFTVPQKYFCHFYIVGVFWTTLLLVMTWLYAYRITAPLVSETLLHSSSIAGHINIGSSYFIPLHGSSSTKTEQAYGVWLSVFLLLLMEVQVLRRLFESIYVFKYSPSARMHIVGYLTGLSYYAAAPLSLCSAYATEVFKFAATFIVEGKEWMRIDDIDWSGFWKPFMQLRWYAWVGAATFLWGWVHQRRCHAILGLLRANAEQVDKYVIPRGDWFDYVSSPHYLAEIVIYVGLVLASGGSDITIWLMFGFVVANLVFAATETHRWYIRKFDDYPRKRYAIIPFVY